MKRYSSITKANSRRISRTKTLLRVASLFTLLILFGVFLPRAISVVGSTVMYPYHMVRVWFAESSSSLPSYLRDRAELVGQIRDLESKLAAEQDSNGSIRKLLDENMELRSLYSASSTPRISARVIARPNALPYDLIQIDQGSKDGVQQYAPVFLGRDQVIGYVTHVTPTYSFVELVTTPGFTSTVYIIGANIYTTAEGMGGGVMRVQVPQGVPLGIGDLVLLPAVNSGIYGEVIEVDSRPTQPQQYGYLSPQVAMQSLRYVSVGFEPIVAPSFTEVESAVRSTIEDLFVVNVPADRLIGEMGSSTPTSTPTSSIQIESE